MSVVKKHPVTRAWLNSAANANTLSAGDFYVVERDGTYQATSSSTFVKQAEAQPLPTFGTAAEKNVEDFATAAQGDLADAALQEEDLKTVNGQSIVGLGDIEVSSEAKLWVSGTAYTAGQFAISPLSFHQYIRLTNGAGATDPANDKVNWRLIGAGGIKTVQRGVIAISGSAVSATATVSAVVLAASELTFLGHSTSNDPNPQIRVPYLSLTNQTTVTATRVTGGTSGTTTVSWQLVERWS